MPAFPAFPLFTRHSFRSALGVAAIGSGSLLAPPPMAHAGIDQTFKLTANDGEAADQFGWSVALSGNTALVGARVDDDNGSASGSAYLFDATTGQQTFKLTPNDGAAGDSFGISVALSGNTALVGAYQDDDDGSNSGSAYLFDATTGQQTFKLTPNDGAANDEFGFSVALSGNTALVGARSDDDNGTNSGSAYLFDATTGLQTAKLNPSDGAANDRFGYAVALSGNTALVGAIFDDDNGNSSGSAYLFDATTGFQTAKLTPSDGAADDSFGHAVALSGNTALVGAYLDDDNGFNSGSAYLFDATTGLQTAKLTPNDGAAGDFFGFSVALNGNTALVGALLDDDSGSESGSAYLFDATTGLQTAKLTPNDGAAFDWFGFSVALSDDTALVGAIFDDDNSPDSGSAYLFGPDELTETPVTGASFEFTLEENEAATLDDVLTLTNTGTPGSTITVTGFTLTDATPGSGDAAFFSLPDFAVTDLIAVSGGDPASDSVSFDLAFLGGPIKTSGEDYAALLTIQTDSGDVTYDLSAVVPEPATGLLFAPIAVLLRRRRSAA